MQKNGLEGQGEELDMFRFPGCCFSCRFPKQPRHCRISQSLAGTTVFLATIERLWVVVAAIVSKLVGPQVQI